MGPKQAATVLAMAREGRDVSPSAVEQAQSVLGYGLGHLRDATKVVSGRKFFPPTDHPPADQDDPEDQSD